MKKVLLTAVSALTLAVTACSAHNTDHSSVAAKLVLKSLHGQAKITKTFDVSQTIEGFVIEPVQGGRGMVVFAQKDGQYLFAGNLLNAKGKNLTQEYTQKYVLSAMAKNAAKGLAQTSYLTEGKDSAKHKMYVFFDPNCSACHIFYKDVNPLVEKGEVQIRWVPVAFRSPSSPGKAALILSGKTNSMKAAFLAKDEKNFDMKTENGGLTPLKKDKSNATLFDQVEANTKFFAKKSFYATPTIVFKDKKGKTQVITGAIPPGPRFDAFLATVDGQW